MTPPVKKVINKELSPAPNPHNKKFVSLATGPIPILQTH